MFIPVALLYLFNVAQLPNDRNTEKIDHVTTGIFLIYYFAIILALMYKNAFWNCAIMCYASIIAIMIAHEKNNKIGKILNLLLFLFSGIMAIINY